MIPVALAEIIGTFSMIFVGGGSILLVERWPHLYPAWIIPLTWGSIITIMIFIMGHVSGAHFNPAVTLAFSVARKIPLSHVPLYWSSQFAGGVAAILILEGLKKI